MGNKFFILVLLVALTACTAPPRTREFRGEIINAKGDRKGVESEIENWFIKDRGLEQVEGVSSDRAYAELNLKTPATPVIVAVIDSGVDVNHEDLKGHIWVNSREVPGNGVDDDQNGYVDDINGWNFLGTKTSDGQIVNIEQTTLEVTRECARLRKLKATRELRGESLTSDEQALLDEVNKIVEENGAPAQKEYDFWLTVDAELRTQYEILKSAINLEYARVNAPSLRTMESTDPAILAARDRMRSILFQHNLYAVADVLIRLEYFGTQVKYYDVGFDPRADLMHDNYLEIGDRFYGNNDVMGRSADHGTHVSGMIAATRGNGLGIDGVATNVRIMVLRAVPDGDEYDKDIANSVRYAVDNGAQIINMSFGKAYSPLKGYVDEAFKYAASKNVLIVHAAGNSSQNNDTARNFPNRTTLNSETIPGWIEVGASSYRADANLPADFSNYGKNSVDLFAPGVNIKSSVPGNMYAVFSGTSMACPSTAGVAALVLSQRADIKAVDLKALLMTTGHRVGDLQVNLPWAETSMAPMVRFDSLSVSGVIANAYEALKAILPMVN